MTDSRTNPKVDLLCIFVSQRGFAEGYPGHLNPANRKCPGCAPDSVYGMISDIRPLRNKKSAAKRQ
ncbi:hypothetical protein [Paenibacillus sp. y28]|uniref:hypothetical protein n=1 Tax=Paenibacillus sp. y28 TaxID=3129110 RepID=UPI00301761CC